MLKINGKKVGLWDIFKNPVADAVKMPKEVGGVYEMVKAAVKVGGVKVKAAEAMKKVEEGLHTANLATVDLGKLKKILKP